MIQKKVQSSFIFHPSREIFFMDEWMGFSLMTFQGTAYDVNESRYPKSSNFKPFRTGTDTVCANHHCQTEDPEEKGKLLKYRME